MAIFFYSSLGKLVRRVTFISTIKMRKLKSREEEFFPRDIAIHQQRWDSDLGPSYSEDFVFSVTSGPSQGLHRETPPQVLSASLDAYRCSALPVGMPTHWIWGRAAAPPFSDKHPGGSCSSVVVKDGTEGWNFCPYSPAWMPTLKTQTTQHGRQKQRNEPNLQIKSWALHLFHGHLPNAAMS